MIFRGFYGRFGPWDVPNSAFEQVDLDPSRSGRFFVPETVDGKDIPRPTTGKHTKNPMKTHGDDFSRPQGR